MDLTETQSILRVSGLSRGFDEGGIHLNVLDNVNLTVDRGETIALIGRSGSGKSTLLNLIAGIDRPDAGDVIFNGVSVRSMNENQRTLFRRRHIGFVYQFFNLLPTLTVRENVMLPLELLGWNKKKLGDATFARLNELGLGARLDSYPDRLSGGEQQRVALARAVVHNPTLILADEPTGNLDRESAVEVLDLLDRLTASSGCARITVTHSDEVAARSQRVLELADGAVRECP